MVRSKAVMLAITLEHKSMKPTSSYKCQPEKNPHTFFLVCACQHTHSVQCDKTLVVNMCMQPK